jgi:hypothetical protein
MEARVSAGLGATSFSVDLFIASPRTEDYFLQMGELDEPPSTMPEAIYILVLQGCGQ